MGKQGIRWLGRGRGVAGPLKTRVTRRHRRTVEQPTFSFVQRGPSFLAMPIIGHGIDIVETSRIRQLVEEHGQRFLDRCYTPLEQAYCNRNTKRHIEHLSGRFAAKEAVLKVLGTGWRGGIAWTDIEIRAEPSGQPAVTLTGECLRIASAMGITQWHVSISHIQTHATASAIGLRGDGVR
jgi:holo-[acyl-carrier protein] synthase